MQIIVGSYGRYSSDNQRDTSIEDQLRRCRETAEKHGLIIDDRNVFADRAVSGTAAGRAKRVAYESLLKAVANREIDVLVIDEVSRAGRTALDCARLFELLESTGTRLITCDGIDSSNKAWKVMWGVKSLISAQEIEATAERVVRGMIGQLERGFMIAQPSYGYVGIRHPADKKKTGAVWQIDEPKAAVVRKLYAMRHQGLSFRKIAKSLNEDGLLPPAFQRCKGTPCWRAPTVQRILANKIYKGIFVWNGSGFTRAKAALKRKVVEEKPYDRPHLRLVSDEVWDACNPTEPKCRIRGGGRHTLAGIARCGPCGAALSIRGGKKTPSAYCPQCEQLKGAGANVDFLGYTSVQALKLALEFCMRELFSGEIQAEFRARLRNRLTEGSLHEQSILQDQLKDLNRSLERLKRALLADGMKEEWLHDEIVKIGKQIDEKKSQISALKKREAHVTAESVEAQVNVDPLPLLRKLLSDESAGERARATLKRLIKRFDFVAREGRFCRTFEIEFTPGVWVAEVSDTPAIESSSVVFRVTVTTGKVRPTVWTVEGHRL